MRQSDAVRAIERHGILLVYPINNQREPASLWSVGYPKSAMRWEWDEHGDDRVAQLWHLREQLSRSKKVVYVKWYQGRATFFSRRVFTALRRMVKEKPLPLGRDARAILEILAESSPRSTKELKRASGLQGRLLESTYERALRELWRELLIVGFGEVDEGAFPSLAVGATSLLFEDLEAEADELSLAEAEAVMKPVFAAAPKLHKFYLRSRAPRSS